MIGFNHALTGGLIANYVPLPIAIPAAFISHFILDALPHYGIKQSKRDHSIFWKVFYSVDALATFGLAAYAIYDNHYAMFLGGLAGVMPDFIWVATVIRTKSFNLSGQSNWFARFHTRIQRYERPWGLALELPLAAFLFYIVMIVLW